MHINCLKENLKERAQDSHTLLSIFPFNILPSTPSYIDFFSLVLLNKTFYQFIFCPFWLCNFLFLLLSFSPKILVPVPCSLIPFLCVLAWEQDIILHVCKITGKIMVMFGLVYLFIHCHICNIGHISYRLQFTTQLIIYGRPHNTIYVYLYKYT
jgi:hypothetical protein